MHLLAVLQIKSANCEDMGRHVHVEKKIENRSIWTGIPHIHVLEVLNVQMNKIKINRTIFVRNSFKK